MMHLLTRFFLILSPLIFIGDIYFADSVEKSKEEDKKILLIFSGSDWCTLCIQLNEEVFESLKIVDSIEKKYIIHKADFPRRKKLSKTKLKDNESLAEKYNPTGIFPKIIVIDPVDNSITTINYYPGKEKEFLDNLKLTP
jgi:thioredoxin-related protein